MPKVSHYNIVYFLRNKHLRYVKYLFTNKKKTIAEFKKSDLLFKKNTNLRILMIKDAEFSGYVFYMNPNM